MDEVDSLIVNNRLSLPLSELDFRFTTGGGPGGQHVNRSATRVTLRFDVAGSPSLDEETRARLLARLANRLDREGVLQFSVQESRSQFQNRQIALERLRETLANALVEEKPRRATRPGRSAVEERLAEKRRRAIAKRERRGNWRDLD
jgi:ribosome-associated protein